MQRYFADHYENNLFYLSKEDRHHIVNVMRLSKGDSIVCTTTGKSALCKIEEITEELVIASVVKWEEENNELPVHVTIASGLPKGDKLEWIVQKGTELGARKFIPFAATRSIVKWDEKKAAKKVERLRKIAKEAAEQSHRQAVPEIYPPVRLDQLIKLGRDYDYKLVAFEEEGKQGENIVLHETLTVAKNGQSLLLVFGPEGGLTMEEISLLKENGFKACGLGPRILRTETAPLYALSVVSYHTELMR